jgi:molecular chaperone DnaK (HSP70)
MPDDRQRLLLVAEPTAAALYCLGLGRHDLAEPGSRFLVIDAGGGTVDLSGFAVAETGVLNQLTTPGGNKAGSEYLNEEFVNSLLVDRFGAEFVARMLRKELRAVGDLVNTWERRKRWIRPSDDTVMVPLGAKLYRLLMADKSALRRLRKRQDGVDDAIVVQSSEISKLFDVVLDQVVDCVDDQLDQMASAGGGAGKDVALLVGGFAESALLQARLSSFLARREIKLHIPERPSIAVVTGAVHFGYDPSVFASLRAPYTYGVEFHDTFRFGVDPEELLEYDEFEHARCRSRFHVLVVRGTAVRVGTRLPARTFWTLSQAQSSIGFSIFRTTRSTADYTIEPGVTRIGRVAVDLTDVMHLPWEQRVAEVSLIVDAHEIRVVGRNPTTNVEESAKIDWEPTW